MVDCAGPHPVRATAGQARDVKTRCKARRKKRPDPTRKPGEDAGPLAEAERWLDNLLAEGAAEVDRLFADAVEAERDALAEGAEVPP